MFLYSFSDARHLEVSMVTLNTPSATVDLQYLRQCLPNYLNNDSVCFHIQNKLLSSIVKGQIRQLNNLVVDKITDRLLNGYCVSLSTKTKVIPIAVLSKYKPALDMAPFRDVQVVVIQKENEQAFLAIIGTNNLCLNVGNFYYSIQQNHHTESTNKVKNHHNKSTGTIPNKSKGSTKESVSYNEKSAKKLQYDYEESTGIYRGISTKQIQWKWIEQSESYPIRCSDNVKQLMLRMGFPISLNLSQPTKIMQWNQESCYKLFKDKNASFVAHFNDFEKQYTIKDVYTEILTGGRERNRSTIFYLAITSDVTLSRTFRIIMEPYQFRHLTVLLDLKSYERFLSFYRVSCLYITLYTVL